MASKETKEPDNSSRGTSNDELLDELASFLYDAYRHSKERDSDKIEPEKGKNADNKGDIK